MLPEYFEFSLPTRVIYGIGILGSIERSVGRFGKRGALLVTDKILVDAGPVDKVRAGFSDSQVEIAALFDDVPPNSTLDTVVACADLMKQESCDMVIAVGGGSVMDTAKVANLLAVKGGEPENHMGAYLLGADEQLLPMVFIPTTAGTGSEVTRVAVIADPKNEVKLPFTEEQFLPSLAILDPELTVSMPGKLTAATGMDALTHAIEAYVGKEWSPASDALSLKAITLITENILKACARPDDLQARGAMLVGSFLAGLAFSHSMVGMCHGISHALGGVYHIPHGLANALVLPEVMEYNMDGSHGRYADVAEAMGICYPQVAGSTGNLIASGPFPNITGKFFPVDAFRGWMDVKTTRVRTAAARAVGNFRFVDRWIRKQAAMSAVDKIRNLNRQLAHLTGMPLNLRDAGIDDNLAKLERVADTAMEDGAMLYNPREPSRDQVIRILRKLYDSRETPLPVSEEDLFHENKAGRKNSSLENVFDDSDMLYNVLVGFYEKLAAHPDIGPALLKTGLCVRFVYKEPEGIITIDATGGQLEIVPGDFEGRPEVTMTMNADFAHKFWHGKANLVTALTRRQVTAKGNVAKTLKLLPILKPAFELYPLHLEDMGLSELVIRTI